jgi:hypothetical protein
MPQGLMRLPEIGEHADERGMGFIGEGIDGGVAARVHEGALGRPVAPGQLGQDRDVGLPPSLALRGAPLLEAEAGGKIQAVGELAAEEGGALLQPVRRGGARCPQPVQVDAGAVRGHLHVLASGHEVRVEERAQLRQRPAELRPRVVRSVPEEVAQALAPLGAACADEVGEEGPGLA